MKQWLAKFSIQRKIITLLALGFCGFLFYFVANYMISHDNQRLMTAVIEDHLPMLEAAEALNNSLASMKNAIAQNALSSGMDAIANLESTHTRIEKNFADIKLLHSGAKSEVDQIHQRYVSAYQGASDALQNVLAGLETLSAVQSKLQAHNAELGNLEKWAVELKLRQTTSLKASIDNAIVGSRRAIFVGWVLVFGAIPFAIFFLLLMKDVAAKLQVMSSRLTEVAQHVLEISNEASTSSARLASASGQQAAAVTESVSSMEEMKSMLGQTVRHSSEALNSSEESFREAANGQSVVDDLRIAMRDIEHAYSELEEVNQVVSSIRNKTNIINDIVFKTQLLSFNASIEAARAGQHGRGFSVVAAEVGKLAEMSGVAAQEIGKLLDQSTRKVAEIVESTKGKVGSANQMSMKCATVFERITNRTGEVKSMVDAITGAASEQEAGIQQVSRAMMEMKDSSDQNDKMAHDISELSESLKGQSQALASTVDRLEMLVHGTHDTPGQIHRLKTVADKPEKKSQPKSA